MTACPRRHRFRTLINTDENDGPKIRQSTLRGKCRLKPDAHFLCKPGQARVCIEWRSLILGHPDAPARPKKSYPEDRGSCDDPASVRRLGSICGRRPAWSGPQ